MRISSNTPKNSPRVNGAGSLGYFVEEPSGLMLGFAYTP